VDELRQRVYFIGLSMPPDLAQQISELQWRLHELGPAMLKPLSPHITLLHPPSLRGIMPSELLPRVHRVAERYLPLTIALQDIGFFGKRVCYIAAQSHQLISLQAELMRLLPPEARELHYKRPFLPHITLAQIYQPRALDKSKVCEIVSDHLLLPRQFKVEHIDYFQRILPREYKAENI
jgi:2'-5' RNA ligase